MYTPFAVQLYRELLTGKSVEQLSREFHIPFGRVQIRLRAAEIYTSRRSSDPELERESSPTCTD